MTYDVEVRAGALLTYRVQVDGVHTPGAAARVAFRQLIRQGHARWQQLLRAGMDAAQAKARAKREGLLLRQPQTDWETGGWKGVRIQPKATT